MFTKISMQNAVSGVLGVLAQEVLGLDTRVKNLSKEFDKMGVAGRAMAGGLLDRLWCRSWRAMAEYREVGRRDRSYKNDDRGVRSGIGARRHDGAGYKSSVGGICN